MAYPLYLRKKARKLRRERHLTIDELAHCLALPRTTIYYWVRDLPIPKTTRQTAGQRRATRAMQARCRRAREEAYEEAQANFLAMSSDSTFRDFINLYLAEGYKRHRNNVGIANSDPAVMRLANRWITALTTNMVDYRIAYHVDQRLEHLRSFWGAQLGVPPSTFKVQKKSNSNGLNGRMWRSRWGVLHIHLGDTRLRAWLEGWMDCLREEWLDSADPGA